MIPAPRLRRCRLSSVSCLLSPASCLLPVVFGLLTGPATAQMRWADSPPLVVDARAVTGGMSWGDSSALAVAGGRVARGMADSNSFGIDSPAPPPDQPAPRQSVPTVQIDLNRLRVWDAEQRRFVDPAGPITIDLSQPTYLLTHGWDDSLNPLPIDACPAGYYSHGMSSIATAIHEALPEANLLGWEWGDCVRGSNPNCLADINLEWWDLVATFLFGPRYVVLRAGLVLVDAFVSGRNAGTQGAALAEALDEAVADADEPLFGSSLHLIGHSHGGGLMARAAEQLYQRGMAVASLTMLDTPRWGVVNSMSYLANPGRSGHVAVYYGDFNPLVGWGGFGFGQRYRGEASNVTSIRLHRAHVDGILHTAIRGDDHEYSCGEYASWFAEAIRGGILFADHLPTVSALDPRTMPGGWYFESAAVQGEFWPVGACRIGQPPNEFCVEVDFWECTAQGGVFQGAHTACEVGLPLLAEDNLRLLSYNGFESAADWFGTGAVVASGSDPANPANVVVRIVDVGEASFFRDIDWPTDAFAIEFDYMFDEFAVEESLTVYVGQQIVHYDAADISLARGGLRSSGPIAVGEFAGTTAPLNFVLRGDGVFGGMCLIDNLRIYALPAGDVDFDGDVDEEDALRLLTVMGGPGITQPPPGGSARDFDGADFDEDGDVDLRDVWLMQGALP